MGRKQQKSTEDQIEEISDTMIKQIALLHLPQEFKNQFESDDIDAIAELVSVPIQELVLGMLNAHAIGYLGSIDEESEKPTKRKAS